jgi:hypothetical protein
VACAHERHAATIAVKVTASTFSTVLTIIDGAVVSVTWAYRTGSEHQIDKIGLWPFCAVQGQRHTGFAIEREP